MFARVASLNKRWDHARVCCLGFSFWCGSVIIRIVQPHNDQRDERDNKQNSHHGEDADGVHLDRAVLSVHHLRAALHTYLVELERPDDTSGFLEQVLRADTLIAATILG